MLGITWRQPAAMILDLYKNTVIQRIGVQHHFGMGVSKLESVLQQISQCCQQQVAVALYS